MAVLTVGFWFYRWFFLSLLVDHITEGFKAVNQLLKKRLYFSGKRLKHFTACVRKGFL